MKLTAKDLKKMLFENVINEETFLKKIINKIETSNNFDWKSQFELWGEPVYKFLDAGEIEYEKHDADYTIDTFEVAMATEVKYEEKNFYLKIVLEGEVKTVEVDKYDISKKYFPNINVFYYLYENLEGLKSDEYMEMEQSTSKAISLSIKKIFNTELEKLTGIIL